MPSWASNGVRVVPRGMPREKWSECFGEALAEGGPAELLRAKVSEEPTLHYWAAFGRTVPSSQTTPPASHPEPLPYLQNGFFALQAGGGGQEPQGTVLTMLQPQPLTGPQ